METCENAKITVKRIGKYPKFNDSWIIEAQYIKDVWCDFFLKTSFCRIPNFYTESNKTIRARYNAPIYIVSANNRQMIYNSNYVVDNPKFYYVKEFVNYVLDKYKYKTI